MNELQDLLDNNERWADAIKQEDPEFFAKLARQQTPEYLWIGCSDARVPANEIVKIDFTGFHRRVSTNICFYRHQ